MTNASVEPRDSPDPPAVARARRISRVLDDLIRIPGTRRRVGLDPLLGLLPGLGDWVTLVISLDLLFSAARMGAGGAVLVRMTGNILLDALGGMVPLAGDLFDLGWKANKRNLALLEGLLRDPDRTRRRSRWVIGSILAGAVTMVAAGVWLGWLVLRWVVGLI
ncbi:MAG: DUF4112 domain-containing protein [Gemmatimonadota bacterium]